MKSTISGWSMSSTTIFAARRVVPPDFVAPAPRSSTSRKLMSPDDVPPPESFSMRPRSFEKFVPVPEPNLNTRASFFTSSKIDMRSSPTDWMKHADTCGREYESTVICTSFVDALTAKLPPEPPMPYS
jgi:hypothetical protein